MSNLGELCRIVMTEPALIDSFTAAQSEAELFAMVIALGQERGLQVTAEELTRTVSANRRAWLERWVPV